MLLLDCASLKRMLSWYVSCTKLLSLMYITFNKISITKIINTSENRIAWSTQTRQNMTDFSIERCPLRVRHVKSVTTTQCKDVSEHQLFYCTNLTANQTVQDGTEQCTVFFCVWEREREVDDEGEGEGWAYTTGPPHQTRCLEYLRKARHWLNYRCSQRKAENVKINNRI